MADKHPLDHPSYYHTISFILSPLNHSSLAFGDGFDLIKRERGLCLRWGLLVDIFNIYLIWGRSLKDGKVPSVSGQLN